MKWIAVVILLVVGFSTQAIAGDEQKAAVMKLQMLVEAGVKFEDYRDAVINAKVAEISKDPKVAKSLECYDDALKFWGMFNSKKKLLGKGRNASFSAEMPPDFYKQYADKYGIEVDSRFLMYGYMQVVDSILKEMLSKIWATAKAF